MVSALSHMMTSSDSILLNFTLIPEIFETEATLSTNRIAAGLTYV